ncbi:MAG: carbon-nitrogen hydrolase family protein [Myxococcota bacterium]
MRRVRVAAVQYFFRPVRSWEGFRDQVQAVVETVADYGCRLMVLPEYFTAQCLSLGDTRRPIAEQVRSLADLRPRFVEMMEGLARRHELYIAAGTIPTHGDGDDVVHNDCYFFGPGGEHGVQGKLHMTRFEREDWLVTTRDDLKVFDTALGRIAIAICYDVEFPEIVRAAALAGARILLVPSSTDDRLGYWRVRYCAQARAIENQMYVIQASTVGSLPTVPDVALHYGQSCILTPSDFAFARDGILAEGVTNTETIVVGELNLETIDESRDFGTVLPLLDSKRTRAIVKDPEVVSL